jgi:hypothetical protein
MIDLEKELIDTFTPSRGDPGEVVQQLASLVAVCLGPASCFPIDGRWHGLLQDATQRQRWPFYGARRG